MVKDLHEKYTFIHEKRIYNYSLKAHVKNFTFREFMIEKQYLCDRQLNQRQAVRLF